MFIHKKSAPRATPVTTSVTQNIPPISFGNPPVMSGVSWTANSNWYAPAGIPPAPNITTEKKKKKVKTYRSIDAPWEADF